MGSPDVIEEEQKKLFLHFFYRDDVAERRDQVLLSLFLPFVLGDIDKTDIQGFLEFLPDVVLRYEIIVLDLFYQQFPDHQLHGKVFLGPSPFHSCMLYPIAIIVDDITLDHIEHIASFPGLLGDRDRAGRAFPW